VDWSFDRGKELASFAVCPDLVSFGFEELCVKINLVLNLRLGHLGVEFIDQKWFVVPVDRARETDDDLV